MQPINHQPTPRGKPRRKWINYLEISLANTGRCALLILMGTALHRDAWSVGVRHCALMLLLVCVGVGVYWFTCEPDREWPSRTMHYKDLMITDSPNFMAEQRRIAVTDTTRILVGSCLIGLVAVGIIRVIKSWKKSLG